MTLLDKAKSSPLTKTKLRSAYNEEVLELCLAWIRSEISTGQLQYALKDVVAGGMMAYRVSMILREAIRRGEVAIIKT